MMSEESKPKRIIGIAPAVALTIGNMIGVGVFTSLGYQVLSFSSGFVIVSLWVAGGIYALVAHPAEIGFGLAMLGIVLATQSLIGIILWLLLLLPLILSRIIQENRLIAGLARRSPDSHEELRKRQPES